MPVQTDTYRYNCNELPYLSVVSLRSLPVSLQDLPELDLLPLFKFSYAFLMLLLSLSQFYVYKYKCTTLT